MLSIYPLIIIYCCLNSCEGGYYSVLYSTYNRKVLYTCLGINEEDGYWDERITEKISLI